MIRTLIKFGLLLLVCVVGYNYFFGNETERAQSERIVGKVRDVGRDAWDLLRSEKQKYREGKYDGAVDKVGDSVEGMGELLRRLNRTARDLEDSGALERISELQDRQRELEAELENETPESYNGQNQERIEREVENLLRSTEEVMNRMDKDQ